MVLKKSAAAILFAGLLSITSQATMAAESVNFVSWGGSTQDAQKQAWADPFSKASGITVVQDGPTDYGKLKAMVESGNVQWDVVDVEADFALRAAAEGLLEPLDFSIIQRDKIDPRFVSDLRRRLVLLLVRPRLQRRQARFRQAPGLDRTVRHQDLPRQTRPVQMA